MAHPDPFPSFSWNAADYHRSSPAQQRWAEELIAKIGLSGNERVLDIGCGDGKITAEIARTLPQGMVTGVDSSVDMIRFAGDHFPPGDYPNLSFREADARFLPFQEEFEVVFSNAALHWISDHPPVLAGIERSLKPGGRMVIQMGGKGNAADMFDALDALLVDPAWVRYFTGFSFTFGFFSDTAYRGWLAGAGLDPLRVELIPKDMTYASRQDFAAWIRTTWLPWMARLPEDVRPRFTEALIDKYLKKFPADGEGIIHIRMVRLEVLAKKPCQ